MKKYFSKIFFWMLLFISISSCHQKFKPLEYRKLSDFKFEVFSFKKIVFKTNLQMYNPNAIGIDVLNSDMDIYINDRLLGKSKQGESIRINRISEFSIPLEVEVETGKINLSFLKGMWESMQKGKVKVQIKGNCKLRKLGIPFTYPIDYSDDVDLKVPDLF
jgi:LEA14-like dessication related protein